MDALIGNFSQIRESVEVLEKFARNSAELESKQAEPDWDVVLEFDSIADDLARLRRRIS